jgi:hypothetical protein
MRLELELVLFPRQCLLSEIQIFACVRAQAGFNEAVMSVDVVQAPKWRPFSTVAWTLSNARHQRKTKINLNPSKALT